MYIDYRSKTSDPPGMLFGPFKITLDGAVVNYAFYADTEKGEIGTYDVDGNGTLRVAEDGKEPVTIFRTGKVEFVPRDSE